MGLRIVSWNVNSLRARIRRVTSLIERHEPDVFLIQETKCNEAQFEELRPRLEAVGYDVCHSGVDHWNGVAILSRVGLEDTRVGFPGTNQAPFDECRLISARCAGIEVHNVYVPNGRELDDAHYLFKLVWLERLRSAIDTGKPVIVAGDFNVAPADVDIYDPRRFRRTTHASAPERAAIETLLSDGLVDVTRSLHPDCELYSFWNYQVQQFRQNRGLRIDLALCSSDIVDRTTGAWIDRSERDPDVAHPSGEKPSDHAPLVLDLETR